MPTPKYYETDEKGYLRPVTEEDLRKRFGGKVTEIHHHHYTPTVCLRRHYPDYPQHPWWPSYPVYTVTNNSGSSVELLNTAAGAQEDTKTKWSTAFEGARK